MTLSHRELVGRRLVDRPDPRRQPARRAEVERDAVDRVRVTVVVPIARTQAQRRTDGDVVDRRARPRSTAGTTPARARAPRTLRRSARRASCDATRDAVAVAASRRSCSACVDARETARDLRGDLSEEMVGRSEIGLQLARDEHAERRCRRRRADSGVPRRRVRTRRAPRSASAPGHRRPSPITPCTGYICATTSTACCR